LPEFLVGPYTGAIDATRLMWAFFREHPRRLPPAPGGAERTAGRETEGSRPVARNEALRRELLERVKVDQNLRAGLIRGGREESNSSRVESVEARLKEVDRANTQRMKEIVAAFGWPGRSLVGLDGAQAAFLLVQHADRDPAFQKACLPLVERAFAAGEVPGEALALLTDRVLVAEGELQLYGSQTTTEDGIIHVRPTADEASLDERRARLGLPPMREYMKMLEEMYHLPVRDR
jgi:hypothetical protein